MSEPGRQSLGESAEIIRRSCDASADHDETGRDLEVLAVVGRMYLDALDADPDNEMLTLPGALLVTEVRKAVERQERRTEAPGE